MSKAMNNEMPAAGRCWSRAGHHKMPSRRPGGILRGPGARKGLVGRRAVMCYDERIFRSWATKRVQKREKDRPASEPDRSQLMPDPPAPTPETKRRKDVERELEEIV